MFSKVFRLEKKPREERVVSPRPASSGDKRPNYYPLQQSSLMQTKKRMTVNDAQAEAMEHELDLLELVCRSDSLHRRLDELQAKYEKMDDGMDSLKREVEVCQDPLGRQTRKLGFRVSRSFEEPESKKPNILQRIFKNRLSKSKDDLNLEPPRSSSAMDDHANFHACEIPPPLPMRQRRSASEDMLSSKDFLERPSNKRQSWGSEVWKRDTHLFLCPATPPPPPPPPPPSLAAAEHKSGGLKRKRAIRIPNPNTTKKKDPSVGSTESCSDSADSDREGRARSSGAGFGRQREMSAPGHLDTTSALQWEKGWNPTSGNTSTSDRIKTGELFHRPLTRQPEVWKYDPVAVAQRTPRESRDAAEGALQRRREAFAKDKRRIELTDPNERPTRRPTRSTSVEERLVRDGTVKRSSSKSSDRGEQPSVSKIGQASPSTENKIKPILKTPERCESGEPETPKTDPLSTLSKAGISREVLLSRSPSVRRHQRSPSSPGFASMASPLKALKTHSSLETSKQRSPQREVIPETMICERGVIPKALSAEASTSTGDSKSVEHFKPKNSDKRSEVSTSSQERAKSSSCQDSPSKLPTTASIQELDHFLSAIIHNLETQLQQSGSSLSLSRQPALEDSRKRRRKKIKEQEESQEERDEDSIAESITSEEQVEVMPMKTKGMSECGACGRRWVEPRLLPCLHTVCTPCLHARATQITPSTTVATTSRNGHASPNADSRRGSLQDQSFISISTPSTATVSPCTVGGTDDGVDACQQWNGNTNNTTVSTSKNEFLPTSTVSTTAPSTPSRLTHQPDSDPPKISAQDTKEGQSDAHASASKELDSVIELLTQLTPNSCSTSPVPKLTVTPTPSLSGSLGQPPPPLQSHDEEVLLSPASTLDSRCSSRTKSSGRSSSCESKGHWVLWCPECGYEAEIPPGGVECFPLNYVLQKQLVLEALNSSSTIIYCDLCHDEVVAEERCDTCPVNLCRLCSHAHSRQRRTAHHKVLSLQEARIKGIREVAHTLVCSTHGEGEVGWWCQECQEPLCATCLATLHCGHPTSTVEQEAPQTRKNMTAILDLATERMGELLTSVEDLTGAATRVQQRGHSVSDQVNAFIDDYILALEEHRQALLRQVRQACERSQRSIVTESQRAGQTASWLRQGCDLTHDLLHHAGDAEALALAPLLSHRLKTLLKDKVEGSARWEKLNLLHDHRAGKVRGHRVQGVIADSAAHPAKSRLKPLCEVGSVGVGARVVALLVARDCDGQPITHGGETVAASFLTADSTTTLCGCSVRDREDGSYEIIFSPPVAGSGALHVTLHGEHVMGSPLEITVKSNSASSNSSNASSGESVKEAVAAVRGRQHTGIFHCCTFCSSGGDKAATCACGATIQGYLGCGHNHKGHPGQKHWSCCAQTSATAACTRPLSQYYQVTL